jgi:hypothetical protein
MFAFLYVGGTVAHVYGAAYPISGSGNKAVASAHGKTSEPTRPTINDRRHIPLVKTVVVPTASAVIIPTCEQGDESGPVCYCFDAPPILHVDLLPCCGRAPPLS